MPSDHHLMPELCPNTPQVGQWKGHACLRPRGHEGAHVHNPAKLEATLAAEAASKPITDQDVLDAFTESEIRRRAEALEGVQELWEGARFKAMPKIPCPNCTGLGQVIGGSLGDPCDRCFGKRVIQDEGEPFIFDMPDFPALRAPLTAYGDALSFRAHGVRAELPPASSVPSLAAIQDLRVQAMGLHRQLGQGRPTPNLLPPAAAPTRSGFETEGGIEATATDAELDQAEADLDDADRLTRERDLGGES